MSIRFDGQVAIVTGAGGGIGKQHALELSRRGAKVVVNDLGGGVDGTGTSDASEEVVDQIKSEGGEAIANGASVTDLEAIKEMTKEDIIKLIFVPSFSQKESVDELSGRGVGMDIVEKNMKKLGGNIGIETEVGKGTTFTLKIKS